MKIIALRWVLRCGSGVHPLLPSPSVAQPDTHPDVPPLPCWIQLCIWFKETHFCRSGGPRCSCHGYRSCSDMAHQGNKLQKSFYRSNLRAEGKYIFAYNVISLVLGSTPNTS